MEYTLIKHLATIGKKKDGRVIEANIIAWNKEKPCVDIRPWSGDHSMMAHGIRLSFEEAEALASALKEVTIK